MEESITHFIEMPRLHKPGRIFTRKFFYWNWEWWRLAVKVLTCSYIFMCLAERSISPKIKTQINTFLHFKINFRGWVLWKKCGTTRDKIKQQFLNPCWRGDRFWLIFWAFHPLELKKLTRKTTGKIPFLLEFRSKKVFRVVLFCCVILFFLLCLSGRFDSSAEYFGLEVPTDFW